MLQHCKHSIWFILLFIGLSIQLKAQVTAVFSADTTKGCTPVSIQFKDASNGTNLRYLWSFGNGNVSSKQNPEAIYYLPGTYTVSLTVTDANGNKHTSTKENYITVFKSPIADFGAGPLSGCAPLAVSYQNKSTKGDVAITRGIWDYGDGNTEQNINGSHTYKTHGKFTVSYVVKDENNCEDKTSKSKYIEVFRSPQIAIDANRKFSCTAPFTVNFKDISQFSLPEDTYAWDFGDGTTSNQRNPSHTYTKKGTFSVRLTITTKDGCVSTQEFTNFIRIGKLDVAFTAPQKVCVGDEVQFTNSSQPTGLTSKWDFGDGTTSGAYTAYHRYTKPGFYSVKLTYTESASCQDSLRKNAYIEVKPYPEADFTHGDTASCKEPFNFYATNTSKNYTQINWETEGKTIGNSASVSHLYFTYGTYPFKLTVRNEFGCSDSKSINVVIEPPEARIHADKEEGCAPLTVEFTDVSVSTDEITERTWNFDDGTSPTTTTAKTIEHTFTQPGIYTVELAIKTKAGCKATTQLEIRVGEKTNPSFELPVDSFCNGEFFFAENTTHLDTPNLNSITWHLFKKEAPYQLDSLVTEEEYYNPYNPSIRDQDDWRKQLNHDSGWYSVALITENNGCYDTIVKENVIYVHNPNASIEVTDVLCNTNEIMVYNTSKGADKITWKVISAKHPTYTSSHDTIAIKRNLHGNSWVSLTAYNDESGCAHTVEKEITFLEFFEADFTNNGDLCSPSYLAFQAKKPDSLRQRYFFEWKIDETYKQGQAVNQTFINAGDYLVRLIMTQDSSECKDTLTKTVTVTGPKIAGRLTFKEGCAPRPIELECTSALSAFEQVYWEIEDRLIPVTTPGVLYDTLWKPGSDSAGFYTIRLVGIDSNGCEGSEEFKVQVTGPLTGTIKVRRFTGCEGNSFLLNAEVPGYDPDNFTYFWDLGNGETNDSRIANVTYSTVDKYLVKLTITDKTTGCVNTYTEEIDIEKERLYADFETDSVLTDCPPVFVEFKNKSIARSRKITSYFWDFGDSTYSIEESPSKLYLAAGRYSVKLWIEDEWGCKDSITYKDIVVVKGPEGRYSFDKKEGCVPLEVNFTSTTKRTNFFEWDMGDGNVIENVSKHTHTYTQPGRYIPLLILSDTFGCSYTLPPIDTIYVAPYPRPGFGYQGTCVNYPIAFDAMDSNSLEIESYQWTMISDAGSEILDGEAVTYTFKNTTNAIVELTLTSVDGCASTLRDTLDLIRLQPAFAPSNANTCVGSEIQLWDQTLSDTTITAKKWVIAGDTVYGDEPFLRLSQPGPVEIQLILENAVGCRDTLTDYSIVAGDTLAPPDLEILRVTVEDDFTVQLDYKPSTLPDFKAYHIYQKRNGQFQPIERINQRDSTTYLHRGNNTLANSYCYKVEVENTCGLMSDTATDLEHCTVNVEAQGGLNHNLVTWNSYYGWDSIRQYRIYRSIDDVNEPLQWIATTYDSDTSYIDSLLYCNTRYVYRIEAIEDGGNFQTSNSDTAKAMPIWDYTPPPPKLVRATVEDDKDILIEWDSSRNSVIPIASYILEKSLDGSTYYRLHSALEDFNYVDQEVLVDDYSYFYRIYAIDECEDTSDFWNYGKTILLQVDTTRDQRPQLAWSTYQGWTEEVSYYGLELLNEDGSFTELATTSRIDSGFIDAMTDLNQRPNYCYRIVGYKELVDGENQVISISNVDCSPVRSAIFYPNAFTPNGDNLNDTYVTPGMYIKEYHIQIFTRWGELIYESENLAKSWDGTYKGELCQQDAYAVIVKTTGVDGIRRVHFGTITLVR